MSWKVAIGILVIASIGLACIGFAVPGDLLVTLATGWAFYLYRTLPQVTINGSAVLSAVACVVLLAVGSHSFLRRLAAETNKPTGSRWVFRWTAAALATVLLMFVSGIAAVGVTHQTAWLVTSPEPITEGGIGAIAARIRSSNNMKEIVLAMQNYSDTNEGRLPPHAIYGERGEPLLSWRVLLLPYLEQGNLFQQFKPNEPWDSPHNLRLLPRIPQVYAPPYDKSRTQPAHTYYQVFVGPGAAFEGKTGLLLPADFPDGLAETILLVEAGDAVPWTKPQDILYGRDRPLPSLGGLVKDGFNAARVDGSVRFVPKNSLSERTLRAAITRNGGEVIGDDW